MFEGFQQRNTRKWSLAGILVGAVLVIVKICLHVIDLDHHESYATAELPAPLAAAVPVEGGWHRTTLSGFSLESRAPLAPVGNYAQGHAELQSYIVNWRIEPVEARASGLEFVTDNLSMHGAAPVTVVEREAQVTLGGQPAFRTTLKPTSGKTQLAYYTECDDRLVELVVDDDVDGKRFVESYRCSPDPVQRASVDRPHVVIDRTPGWKFHPQENKQAFAVYHEADDTIILAHGIAARDVAVRTATAQFFDGTNTDLDGSVTQRGDRYIFGASKRGDPTSSIKIVAWRCSPDEVAIVVALSTTRSGAAHAIPVALSARCLAATDPVPTY